MVDQAQDKPIDPHFGKFILLRRLGRGGMAEVFLAELIGPDGFGKLVALKRILPHLYDNQAFTTAFISEGRLGGSLNHPNIVQTLELGREGDAYYLAMEYVDGITLAQLLGLCIDRHVRLPLPIILDITRQLCDALAYAHAATDTRGRPLNMIHRDLKPDNILISRFGLAKITDFGVSKANTNLRLTTIHGGAVRGTIGYMSPEQACGGPLDLRSDLYSIGAILFEMLAQQPLYPEAYGYPGLFAVQRGEIHDRLQLLEPLPPPLQQLVQRLLARNRDHRYSSAAEVKRDLLAIAATVRPTDRGLDEIIQEAAELLHPKEPLPATDPGFATSPTVRLNPQVPPSPDQAPQTPQTRSVTDLHAKTEQYPPGPREVVQLAEGRRATPGLEAAYGVPAGNPPASSAIAGSAIAGNEVVGNAPAQASPGLSIADRPTEFSRSAVRPDASSSAPRPGSSPLRLLLLVAIVVLGALLIRGVVHRAGPSPKPQATTSPEPDRRAMNTGSTAVPPPAVQGMPMASPSAGSPPAGPATPGGRPDSVPGTPLPRPAPGMPAHDGDTRTEGPPSGDPRPPAAVPATPVEPARTPPRPPTTPAPAVPQTSPRAAPGAGTAKNEPAKGFLSVNSAPFAYVFLDGRKLEDTTPLVDVPVPAGRHTLKFVTEDGRTRELKSVDIPAGKTLTLEPIRFE